MGSPSVFIRVCKYRMHFLRAGSNFIYRPRAICPRVRGPLPTAPFLARDAQKSRAPRYTAVDIFATPLGKFNFREKWKSRTGANFCAKIAYICAGSITAEPDLFMPFDSRRARVNPAHIHSGDYFMRASEPGILISSRSTSARKCRKNYVYLNFSPRQRGDALGSREKAPFVRSNLEG